MLFVLIVLGLDSVFPFTWVGAGHWGADFLESTFLQV